MSRSDLLFIPAFLVLVVAVSWAAFGNPFRLEGSKLQEFVGYILGLLLSAVFLLYVVTRAIAASSIHGTENSSGNPE
jgi:uncharacterized membrane protein